jgi:hypothetical protein
MDKLNESEHDMKNYQANVCHLLSNEADVDNNKLRLDNFFVKIGFNSFYSFIDLIKRNTC